MKKILIALMFMSSFIACNQTDDIVADETQVKEKESVQDGWVTLSQSKESAISYLNSQKFNGIKNTSVGMPEFAEKDIEETFGIEDENQNTLIYIHNLKVGGFVMMSGSVYEVPVLAYSTEGSVDIESMPDELSQWLFLGSKKIAYLQEKQSSYIETSWNNEVGLADQWGI